MIINRKQLEKLVRDNPGISPTEVSRVMGIGRKTVLRHARKNHRLVVEQRTGGRDRASRLWSRYDLPVHLIAERPETSKPSSRFYTLDDFKT